MALVYWVIRDFFKFVGDFIVFVFELLWNLILILVDCVLFIVESFAAMPLWIIAPSTALVIVTVLYKILGREQSS